MADAPAFKVRPARRGDAEGIRALMAEIGQSSTADTVNWVVSHPEMEVMVAADSFDKVVGVVAISHRPQIKLGGRIATIDELAVITTWRRRGVGRELLKRAVDRARVLSVKRIEVQTLQALDEVSRAFLVACGFSGADAAVFRQA